MGWIVIPKPGWNELNREFCVRRDAAVLRGPVEWSWDVTNRCNGRCLHCFNRSQVLERDEMSDDEMLAFAEEIISLEPLSICLCGGEPLLRLDTVYRVTKLLADAGASVSMVTNGSLMTEDVALRLSEAGMKLVQVSLDGAGPESHERLRHLPGGHAKAVAAIRHLRNVDMTVSVSFVPTRFNIHEWRDVYEQCQELGVCDMRLQPLMPLGQCHLSFDELEPSPEQYRTLATQVHTEAWGRTEGTRVEWGDPIDHLIRFGHFYAMVPNMVHISSEGSICLSIYLPIHLGNVRRHSFQEYWEAGLGRAWQLRLVREMAFRVRSNRDFAAIRPHPFFDAPIELDLVERTPEEIERLTDVVLSFLDRVWPSPGRPPLGPLAEEVHHAR